MPIEWEVHKCIICGKDYKIIKGRPVPKTRTCGSAKCAHIVARNLKETGKRI